MRAYTFLAVIVAASVFAGVASAQAGQPWDGGAAVESPLEQLVDQVGSELVGRPVTAVCNSPDDWAVLATQRGTPPDQLWGYVEGTSDGTTFTPSDTMQLSNQACTGLEAYRTAGADAKGKQCKLGERTVLQTRSVTKKVKKKINGKIRLVTVTVKVKVPVKVPVTGTCPGYAERLVALQTVAHEAQHLKAISDEATAECYGTQYMRTVALRFGANADQAQTMQTDYFSTIYPENPPNYKSDQCVDGGALDLNLAPIFP